jgi:hypothetical protein
VAPLGLSLLWCSEIKCIGSAHSPGLAGLRIDDKYSLVVVSGRAGLVSSTAVRYCAYNHHQADTDYEAKGKIFEVGIVLFFEFHSDSSLNLSPSFSYEHIYSIVQPVINQHVCRRQNCMLGFELCDES